MNATEKRIAVMKSYVSRKHAVDEACRRYNQLDGDRYIGDDTATVKTLGITESTDVPRKNKFSACCVVRVDSVKIDDASIVTEEFNAFRIVPVNTFEFSSIYIPTKLEHNDSQVYILCVFNVFPFSEGVDVYCEAGVFDNEQYENFIPVKDITPTLQLSIFNSTHILHLLTTTNIINAKYLCENIFEQTKSCSYTDTKKVELPNITSVKTNFIGDKYKNLN